MQTEAAAESVHTPIWLRLVFGRNPAWTVVRILLVVFSCLVLFKFVLLPIRVTGQSMEPNFRSGQIKFANRLAYVKQSPQRGDVVAIEFAGRDILLLKRVVGLPGETFQVIGGDVYINGEKLDEPYAHGKITVNPKRLGSTDAIKLGETEYMVMGDNRELSEGYFPDEKEIVGKVF